MNYTTLENLKGGAAIEMVNNALLEVWNNTLDPNTDSEAKRSVILKLEFKPSKDRTSSPVTIKVEKKLAPQSAVAAHVNIGTDENGIAAASEYGNPNQVELPMGNEEQEPPKAKLGDTGNTHNVTPFRAANG
ncbi:hypothetical protein [Oleidesulfovibrio sp.]|uniref:hypothetical protein n=1 Tax=Oleidesulfovibrio sp. TaxID=2909707 RepID=UPI003A8835C9